MPADGTPHRLARPVRAESRPDSAPTGETTRPRTATDAATDEPALPPTGEEDEPTAPPTGETAEPAITPTGEEDEPGVAPAAAWSAATLLADAWRPDVLGDGYEARLLPLRPDDEGDVVATLVRHRPPSGETLRPVRAVLYLHGWSDYFFQTGLAEHWSSTGAAFYALDLRKYGRSLRSHQTPGYTDDLAVYHEEIEAALDVVRGEIGQHGRVMVMGHSTGGLVAALWADRNPGQVSGLVLNSPWLELQGSSLARHLSAPAVGQLARFQPKAPLPSVDPGFYARSLDVSTGGEWTYDTTWRPTPSFPVRAGWLAAVMTGHAKVARGLHVAVPVLVAASSRTLISPRWNERMRRADVVLEVDQIARRAVQLGPLVTVVRIHDGLHDLSLSAPTVRARFYAELDRWTATYGWS